MSSWKEAYNLLPNVAARFDDSDDVVRVLPVQSNSDGAAPSLESTGDLEKGVLRSTGEHYYKKELFTDSAQILKLARMRNTPLGC